MVAGVDRLTEALKALQSGTSARLLGCRSNNVRRSIRFLEHGNRVEIDNDLARTANQKCRRMPVLLGNPALAYTNRLFTSGKSDAPDEASGNAYVFEFKDIGEVE